MNDSCVFYYSDSEMECGMSIHDHLPTDHHPIPAPTRKEMHAWLGWGQDCEYPGCSNNATQMAHIHSIGMGGRGSADRLYNVMRVCNDHALVTDGLPPVGCGTVTYYDEIEKIPNVGKRWTHHQAMVELRRHLIATRPVGRGAIWT